MDLDLGDLYGEVILDHSRKPRNAGALEDPTHQANGHNPLCGDRLHVTLRVAGETIEEIRFEGAGCAISQASASLMTERVKGMDTAAIASLSERFRALVKGEDVDEDAEPELDKLEVFSGVGEFPMRVKCATLSWHTLAAALEGRETAS